MRSMEKITVGILAGGKSSRMGCDKAKMLYHGQTFLDHLAQEASAFDELIVSVGNSEKRDGLPYTMVQDELAGFGPVEGIYQILRKARNPYALIIATDMQNLNAAFLEAFARQLQPGDRCMVACVGDLLEPLCSIYHKDALAVLEKMRENGIRKPRALFSKLPTHYVDLEELGFDLHVMDNINTKSDYNALILKKNES